MLRFMWSLADGYHIHIFPGWKVVVCMARNWTEMISSIYCQSIRMRAACSYASDAAWWLWLALLHYIKKVLGLKVVFSVPLCMRTFVPSYLARSLFLIYFNFCFSCLFVFFSLFLLMSSVKLHIHVYILLHKAQILCLSLSSSPSPDWLFFLLYCCLHSALSEEEKTSLRAGLITNFNEPVNQVSGEEMECTMQEY